MSTILCPSCHDPIIPIEQVKAELTAYVKTDFWPEIEVAFQEPGFGFLIMYFPTPDQAEAFIGDGDDVFSDISAVSAFGFADTKLSGRAITIPPLCLNCA